MLKFEYCKPVSAKSVPDGYRGRAVRRQKNLLLGSAKLP
jgi:hypothetical protein